MPVHLLGWGTDLDHKTPKVTARAPQSMLQELLNRDDSRLWAILSNGATLRLLRDSTALVGSAYVEFDLEAIFDWGAVLRLRSALPGMPRDPVHRPR